MKAIKIIIYGILIYIAINLLMLAASIIFSTYEGRDSTWLVSLNSFAAALPIGLITFGLAASVKPANLRNACVLGLIWMGMQVALFFLIGLLNQTLPFIFGAIGFYILMLFTFAGPVIYRLVKGGFAA